MLRLQPSEIGLTSADVHTYKRRLEARRRARVQVLHRELKSTQQSHPRVHRGPARSRDRALTVGPDQVALSYSVYDTSESTLVEDGMQREVNEHPSHVERLLGQYHSSSTENEPFRSSEASAGQTVADQSPRIEHALQRPIHTSQSRRTQRVRDEATVLHGSSRPKLRTTTSDDVQSSERDDELSVNVSWLLDGASDGAESQVHVFHGRRFRPRSWSDPRECLEGPTLTSSRLRPPPTRHHHERATSSQQNAGVQVSSAQQALVLESFERRQQEASQARTTLSTFPAPAAYMALRNTPSPLEKLAAASKTMIRAGADWNTELPFRLASPEIPRHRVFDMPDAHARQNAPPNIVLSAEEDTDATSRPPTPHPSPRRLFDGHDDSHTKKEEERLSSHGRYASRWWQLAEFFVIALTSEIQQTTVVA